MDSEVTVVYFPQDKTKSPGGRMGASAREQGVQREKPKLRLKVINRNQLVLRPMEVERLLPEDHEARAIWEFVGRLDLGR